ncbi:hypothetical protein [Oleispirillum naphthae]|uniref:hypothetical protein n=1 Tax=Oleispirillum naphthae TaxID=2838853 RepID=UPI0030822425
MKPFAVYKLSRIEAALRRLDAAVASLESAAEPCPAGDIPVLGADDGAETARLRDRCDALEAAAQQASEGIGDTMARLKRLLEG